MTDTERLDWLEDNQGYALVSDDFGHWACIQDGLQSVPDNAPGDVYTSFFIKKDGWFKTTREAIDAAIKHCGT